MDGTLTWMLITAGAVIALLGAFLAVSEKELRKKRRELASLAAKLARGTTSTLGTDSENKLSELERVNQNLQEQLSSLSSRLESTERDLAESESGRSHLKNVDAENRQLEISNQKLNEELATLRQQMNSVSQRKDDSQFEKAAYDEQLAKLMNELKYTIEKLEQSESRIEELAAADQSAVASAERYRTEARIESESTIKSLERQLADSQEKLQAFDIVDRQLLELEQRHEKALLENRQLQHEITRWQERLADSEEAQRRLGIIRQQMVDARLRGEMPDRQAQKQLEHWVELLEIQPSNLQAAQPSMDVRSTASAGPYSMDGSAHVYGQTTGLNVVSEYLEPRYQNEITGDATDVWQLPGNRAAQLAKLLAWIRLHGSNPYQEQIDSIKDLTDLSETERHVIRDIFLARADEAQKRGRDEEMLRYRNWAKNIVYHNSLGSADTQKLAEHEVAANNSKLAGNRQLTASDSTPTSQDGAAPDSEPATVKSSGVTSPARNVALGMGIGLGLVLILLIQLFFGTSSEITVAADDPSTPASLETDVIPNKRDSLETSRPGLDSGNAAPVEALRSEGRVRARSDDVKTNVRNTAKETGATANRAQDVWGMYTIVKPTQVFREPTEDSPFITSLDPGTQVNVVAARNGWYEIRSKTGRPPGFIRQEAGSRNR